MSMIKFIRGTIDRIIHNGLEVEPCYTFMGSGENNEGVLYFVKAEEESKRSFEKSIGKGIQKIDSKTGTN